MSIFFYFALLIISGIVIWIASNKLASIVEEINEHYQLGDAFGGLIMLAVVTNLPEVAIVLSGAYRHDLSIAVGNILGGITFQTVLLVLFDAFSYKDKHPLTSLVNKRNMILEGIILIMILTIVLLGAQLQANVLFLRTTPPELMIVATYIIGLFLLRNHKKQNKVEVALEKLKNQTTPFNKLHIFGLLGFTAITILVFGVALEICSDKIAIALNMSGVIFGATILAFITSLPEISSGIALVKSKKYEAVFSDIFGGNAFLPVLFLFASFLSNDAILPSITHLNKFLTTVSILMTCIYVIGITQATHKRRLGIGLDSWVVLILYVLSIFAMIHLF
jgi:cation:H+ antiporter